MTLHRHAAEGNLAAIARSLANGATVDERLDGWTALMTAARSDEAGVDVLRLLVEHGADVNAVSEGQRLEACVLSLAIQCGRVDKVAALISLGANANYRSSAGYDALLDAAYATPSSIELMRCLLDAGCPVNGVSKYGETALKVAALACEMDVVTLLLQRGANGGDLKWGSVARAVALGTLADVEAALRSGADAAVRDVWNRSGWMLALELGDLEKAKLLRAGVHHDERGYADRSSVFVASEIGDARIIEWLVDEGFGIEDRNAYDLTPLMCAAAEGHTEAVRTLLRRGANVHARLADSAETCPVNCARDKDVLALLLAAGGDLADTSETMRRALRSHQSPAPLITREDFDSGRERRFGGANPELMNVPFWEFMVRTGAGAHSARSTFLGESRGAALTNNTPVWCFSRYGQSITILPTGELVEIGGEHEDYYDQDFCIYNDAVVHSANGTLRIWGYPETVFPPTDFHTATYAQGAIYVIGGLGYAGRRAYGQTFVNRLDCTSFAMETIPTGGDPPGWIFSHRARLDGECIVIEGGTVAIESGGDEQHVPNAKTFALDLRSLRWRESA